MRTHSTTNVSQHVKLAVDRHLLTNNLINEKCSIVASEAANLKGFAISTGSFERYERGGDSLLLVQAFM